MTKPENIEQAFIGTTYPVDAATGKNLTIEAVKVAMRRLLCPAPPAPPPSPSPDATEKGGDRARDMATAITIQANYPHGREDVLLGIPGRYAIPIPGYWARVDVLRDALADALRAYGDELLDKAVEQISRVTTRQTVEVADALWQAHDKILALKSSATKGVANG